jgi:DNA-binding response OmpR family regulator
MLLPSYPNKHLILIVEDNKELLAFIAGALETNYRILTAENGVDGLKTAQEEIPDIIISDIMMPEMDGYEFCRLIKSDIKTSHIAFVILTAKASHDSVIEGLMHSADDYITKPFHIDELQLRIRNILDHQEKIRQHRNAQLTNPKEHIDLQTEEDCFLKQLYTVIEEHIDDSSLNVEKLAKAMAVSHRTLNRKLNALLGGLSANDVVKQYRLKKAAELLKHGSKIADIAYRVGFETPAYFSTSFKNFYGVPPSEYMNTVA